MFRNEYNNDILIFGGGRFIIFFLLSRSDHIQRHEEHHDEAYNEKHDEAQ